MSVKAQQAVKQLEAVKIPLIRALSRQNSTHGVLALYLRLLLDADEKAPPRTVAELGEMVGVGERTAGRALRVLRKLGVVRDAGEFLIIITHTADRRILKALEGISQDRGVIDLVAGVIKSVDSDKVFDYTLLVTPDTYVGGRGTTDTYVGGLEGLTHTPDTYVGGTEGEVWQGKPRRVTTYPILNDQQSAEQLSLSEKTPYIHNLASTVVVNTGTSTSTRRNTNSLITDSNPTPKPVWAVKEIPVTADKLPHKTKFVSARDPFRPDIEAVLAYANEQLGTKFHLYSATGAANDRYRIIFRCFYFFDLTLAQLKRAIDNVPRHHFWGPTKVRDLLNLFGKQANVEGLVNYVPPVGGVVDRRALDCAPIPKGTTVITEEF